MATRTRAARLDPEERREQLIELGLKMLSLETPERVPVVVGACPDLGAAPAFPQPLRGSR